MALNENIPTGKKSAKPVFGMVSITSTQSEYELYYDLEKIGAMHRNSPLGDALLDMLQPHHRDVVERMRHAS